MFLNAPENDHPSPHSKTIQLSPLLQNCQNPVNPFPVSPLLETMGHLSFQAENTGVISWKLDC